MGREQCHIVNFLVSTRHINGNWVKKKKYFPLKRVCVWPFLFTISIEKYLNFSPNSKLHEFKLSEMEFYKTVRLSCFCCADNQTMLLFVVVLLTFKKLILNEQLFCILSHSFRRSSDGWKCFSTRFYSMHYNINFFWTISVHCTILFWLSFLFNCSRTQINQKQCVRNNFFVNEKHKFSCRLENGTKEKQEKKYMKWARQSQEKNNVFVALNKLVRWFLFRGLWWR